MCMDTVLCGGDNALMVSCPAKVGEFDTKVDTKGAQTIKVTPEGLKVATLRAGLRRALRGVEGVKLAQRGEETFLVGKGTK